MKNLISFLSLKINFYENSLDCFHSVIAATSWFWCHQLGTDKSESDSDGVG